MLVARVVAAAGLVSSLTLAPGPAMATEPAATQHGASKPVIRRIEPTLPVAPPTQDAPAAIPAADSTHGSVESRLDQRARKLANLRSQVAVLQRTLRILLVSIEDAIQRLEPASADIAAPDAATGRCGASSRPGGPRPTPCSPPARSLTPKDSSPAAFR